MTIYELQQAMSQDEYPQYLKDQIVQGWPECRRSNTTGHEKILKHFEITWQ